MSNKLEQGRIKGNIVNFTTRKLNKSIDFYGFLCYHKNSRDD